MTAQEISPGLMELDPSGVDQVVSDPLRFKHRLRIGEDAYALLRAKKRLMEMWEAAGAAATGAGIAGSATVASTFFAPTGVAAWLGLASAATSVGWVVGAAVVAGGGYYGASRWFAGKEGAFTDTIPKYITTPIDVLGVALVDLLGSLALRVSAIDGEIHRAELQCIADHFVEDWGFDSQYVSRALDALKPLSDDTRVKQLATVLAAFTEANPDCNATAMHAELLEFLGDLVRADGVIDEREELAIEAIGRVFEEAGRMTIAKAGDAVAEVARTAGVAAADVASSIGSAISDLTTGLKRRIAGAEATGQKCDKT